MLVCARLILRAKVARICRTKVVEHSKLELYPVASPPTATEVQVRVAMVEGVGSHASWKERKKTQKRGFQGTPSAHTAMSGGHGDVQV